MRRELGARCVFGPGGSDGVVGVPIDVHILFNSVALTSILSDMIMSIIMHVLGVFYGV